MTGPRQTAYALHHGDCLAVMAGMADKSFDLVLTDPPYESEMHQSKKGGRSIRKDGGKEMQNLDFGSIEPIRAEAARHMVRLSRGWVIAFCTPEGIAPWRDAIVAAGGKYKRALFWRKRNPAPQFNGQGPGYGVECMVAAWCGRGHSSWNGGGKANFYESLTVKGARKFTQHPTEKPLSVIGGLIDDFAPMGTDYRAHILDPFMGGGTTGHAAIDRGLAFTGIEMSRDYFDAAKARLDAAAEQGQLISPRDEQPKQEAML